MVTLTRIVGNQNSGEQTLRHGEQTAHTGISLRAVLIVIVIQLLRSKGKVRNLASGHKSPTPQGQTP